MAWSLDVPSAKLTLINPNQGIVMNMRKITSMTMVWSLIVLTFNSIVLYVVPEGRIANWADWRFWGLDKHDWSAQHTTVGFLFIFAGLLHIYYNWKVIVSYMKDKAKKLKVFTAASSIGLGLTIIFVERVRQPDGA